MLVALSCKSGMCLTCQNGGGEQTGLMCLPMELPGFHIYLASFSQNITLLHSLERCFNFE